MSQAESVPASAPAQALGIPAVRRKRQPAPPAKALGKRVKYGAVSVETPWKTKSEAAGYLGVSVWSIDQLVNRGLLKKYALLGFPRFLLADLDAAVKPCPGPAKASGPQG